MAQKQNTKVANLVRIMGTDLNADSTLLFGLAKIKGISYMFANATCKALGYDRMTKISALSEKEIEKLEEFLANPKKQGIPEWMVNSQKDVQTGENLHYVGKDIEYNALQLRRRLAKTKSYRAIRTKYKLPLRGQRTKSNFRRSKTIAAMKSKAAEGKR